MAVTEIGHVRITPKVPGQFTSLAGEAVTADIEDTFADNVHIVRVFRCVRRPQIQYERILELCQNENEGSRPRMPGLDRKIVDHGPL